MLKEGHGEGPAGEKSGPELEAKKLRRQGGVFYDSKPCYSKSGLRLLTSFPILRQSVFIAP